MLKMEQQLDSLSGPQSKRYMHNYEIAAVLHRRDRPRRFPEAP